MTGLFSYFTSTDAPFQFPGAPFILGSVFMVISALVAYFTLTKEKSA
jgi:MFS transporter, DHA1 family, tetracycline resistance protein